MSLAARIPHVATVDDLLAIPEEERFHEIIDGELVQKAMPTPKHAGAQLRFGELMRPYNRRPGGRWPGGWWFASEVEVAFDKTQIYRPDVVGWRRERLAELPDESPVAIRPDWICEILSPSNKHADLTKKKRVYRRFEVPHYWIIDPISETLSVYRWTAQGYLEVLIADRNERVKAEPFDAVSSPWGFFWGTMQRKVDLRLGSRAHASEYHHDLCRQTGEPHGLAVMHHDHAGRGSLRAGDLPNVRKFRSHPAIFFENRHLGRPIRRSSPENCKPNHLPRGSLGQDRRLGYPTRRSFAEDCKLGHLTWGSLG